VKAKFHDIEIEGTPEEVLEFKLLLEQKDQNAIYLHTYCPVATDSVSINAEAIVQAIQKHISKKVSF
jgi:hypothetical protein